MKTDATLLCSLERGVTSRSDVGCLYCSTCAHTSVNHALMIVVRPQKEEGESSPETGYQQAVQLNEPSCRQGQ